MLNKTQWVKRAFLTVFFSTILVVAIIGLIFGKVVEATLWEEVAKWALMAVVLGGMMCVIFYAPILVTMHVRDELYPQYGKKWWIESIKRLFKKSK